METRKVINQDSGNNWQTYHGDCVEVISGIPDNSVHYSIYSPPFASLYTYSASDRDMGNCKNEDEFSEHFRFLAKELFRVLMPGRLMSFHCMNLPTSKARHGYIGIQDFRGELIRLFCGGEMMEMHSSVLSLRRRSLESAINGDTKRAKSLDDAACVIEQEMRDNPTQSDFIFHSEVCIWKDPLAAATRTKALGLLHKQIVKDSAMCRQGIPDYLVTVRKPGENPEPIDRKKTAGFDKFYGDNAPDAKATDNPMTNKYSHLVWQKYASPVWMDINASKTLQHRSAREEQDERHICPLQLQVIERGIELWSNPNDIVFTPFMGIGSEAVTAVKMGRKAVGVELKESYYNQSVENLKIAESEAASLSLF